MRGAQNVRASKLSANLVLGAANGQVEVKVNTRVVVTRHVTEDDRGGVARAVHSLRLELEGREVRRSPPNFDVVLARVLITIHSVSTVPSSMLLSISRSTNSAGAPVPKAARVSLRDRGPQLRFVHVKALCSFQLRQTLAVIVVCVAMRFVKYITHFRLALSSKTKPARTSS